MLVQSWPLYDAMLYAHWVIFIFAPIALFRAGWPVSGGVSMLFSTLMPLAGQVWFTDSDAPGPVFLLMIEAPVAGLVLLVAIIVSIAAFRERRRARG